MESTVYKRLARGVAANIFSQAVNIFVQVTSVPIFLSFWGVSLYGEWLILFTIPAFLTFSDFGLVMAATNKMTFLIESGDRGKALQVFQGTSLLVFSLSVICTFIVVTAVYALPLRGWFGFTVLEIDAVRIIILAFSLHILLVLQASLMYAGFYCEGAYGLGAFYLATLRLIGFIFLASAIFSGATPEVTAIMYLLGTSVGFMVMRYGLANRVSWAKFGFQYASWRIAKDMFKPSLAFMAFPIGNLLNLQGFVMIVGLSIGPQWVAIFSTLRTLTRVPLQITNFISSSIRPEFTIAYGKNNTSLLRLLHERSAQLTFWAAGFVAVALILFGDVVYEIWTNGKLVMDVQIFRLLLAAAFVNSMFAASMNIFYATSRHIRLSLVYLFSYGSALLLAYILSLSTGFYGIAVSVLVVEIVLFVYTISSANILLKISYKDFVKIVLKPPYYALSYPIKFVKALL